MKTVDFLPARYHENDLRRKATAWRYVLVLMFGGAIGAATFGQFAIKRTVRLQLAELRAQHQAASGVKETAAMLEKELRWTEEISALYTYLRHPWPRTQLLACVARSLPESVAINELRIHQDDSRSGARSAVRTLPIVEGESKISPASRDLQELRGANDSTPTVIHIRGTARDAVELNEYVAALGFYPIFKSAKLTSLEAVNDDVEHMPDGKHELPAKLFQFDILITVLPGHGIPGGPTAPLAEATTEA